MGGTTGTGTARASSTLDSRRSVAEKVASLAESIFGFTARVSPGGQIISVKDYQASGFPEDIATILPGFKTLFLHNSEYAERALQFARIYEKMFMPKYSEGELEIEDDFAF